MAIFTITVNGTQNLPPNNVGVNDSFIFQSGSVNSFNSDDFTINTIPQYSDPEGDPPLNLKILSLPAIGTLIFQGVNVSLNDEIPFSDIDQLEYELPNSVNAASFVFTFNISDTGSQSYNSGLLGVIKGTSLASPNLPPEQVGDIVFSINSSQEYIFTEENFTTETSPEYSDPEGDEAFLLKILTFPESGSLRYNNITINSTELEISFEDIRNGLFTYYPDQEISYPYSMTFDFAIADSGSQEFTS